MVIEFWESQQRQTGNIEAADAARQLKERYGDLPFKPENATKVRTFGEESKKKIEREGFKVFSLSGRSIQSMREAGMPFLESDLYQSQQETLISIASEVAINPDVSIWLGTYKDFKAYAERIEKSIPSITCILGTVSDYVEIEFVFREASGEYLSKDLEIVTSTTIRRTGMTSGPLASDRYPYAKVFNAVVISDPRYGVGIRLSELSCEDKDRRFAPLIVPK